MHVHVRICLGGWKRARSPIRLWLIKTERISGEKKRRLIAICKKWPDNIINNEIEWQPFASRSVRIYIFAGLYRVYIIIMIIINIRGSKIDVRATLAYSRFHIVPLSWATKPRARIKWAKMFNSAVEQLIIQFYLFVCVHNAILLFLLFVYSTRDTQSFHLSDARFVRHELCSASDQSKNKPFEIANICARFIYSSNSTWNDLSVCVRVACAFESAARVHKIRWKMSCGWTSEGTSEAPERFVRWKEAIRIRNQV